MKPEIKRVTTQEEFRAFIRFPYTLYAQSKQWVPPLIRDERNAFNPAKNPALSYCDHVLFLAYRGKTVVGRLAGIINRRENEVHAMRRARFGWYDVLDEPEISEALFEALASWAVEKGMDHVEGPMGFTNMDKMGLLIEGFDELPTVATLYNYPYYKEHLDALGFDKSADYIEYEFSVPDEVPERVVRISDIIVKKYGLRIVNESKKVLRKKYARQLFYLINETHGHLYGFVPFDEQHIDFYISKFFNLIHPDFLVFVVDQEDNLVGYAITMPSYSRAFQKARGRLSPLGIYQLWNASRKVDRADLMLVGVSDIYKNKGIVALCFLKIIESFRERGVQKVESNPELETNTEVHAMWKSYEYRQHKRRRTFRKAI